MTDYSEDFKANEKASEPEDRIIISFHILEKDWPYPPFDTLFYFTDPFLVLEETIKREHGCIKNLQLYIDPNMKNKINYKFDDPLTKKMKEFHVFTNGTYPKTKIYYKFDNGYEWPLLSS